MAIRIERIKSITARTLWGIEAMLAQNAFDLSDMNDEEEKTYYKRMEEHFRYFFERFVDCQKAAKSLVGGISILACGCLDFHEHSSRTGFCLERGCLSCEGHERETG